MRLLSPACLLSSLLGGSVILFASMHTDAKESPRPAEFARLPNWYGVWEPMAPPNATPPVEPVYTSAWVVKHDINVARKKNSPEPVDNVFSQCIWGMPRLLKSMRMFEVIVLPEQTFFSYDINEFRHVWTDGRKHSLRSTPTNTGHSIGHWEGGTLVIETTDMRSGLWINYKGATLSPRATVEERWSQVDNDHLKVDVTIRDSAALLRPFVFSRRFQRADTNRLVQQQCFEESRDARKES